MPADDLLDPIRDGGAGFRFGGVRGDGSFEHRAVAGVAGALGARAVRNV